MFGQGSRLTGWRRHYRVFGCGVVSVRKMIVGKEGRAVLFLTGHRSQSGCPGIGIAGLAELGAALGAASQAETLTRMACGLVQSESLLPPVPGRVPRPSRRCPIAILILVHGCDSPVARAEPYSGGRSTGPSDLAHRFDWYMYDAVNVSHVAIRGSKALSGFMHTGAGEGRESRSLTMASSLRLSSSALVLWRTCCSRSQASA